ncbi:MAG: pantoate kinase [Methanobacteriota archaeon]
MPEAAAFCPGHITGFFSIHDDAPDPERKGSRGAGFSVDLGATSHVALSAAPAPEIHVFIDGEPARDAATTRRAVELLLGRSPVSAKVRTELDLPVSQGFGMSAAGALSAALAVAKAAGLGRSEALRAAHVAEVERRTGLGDVAGAWTGGVEIRRRPGLPPWGAVEKVAADAEIVLCVVGEPVATPRVLSDPVRRKRIRDAGDEALALLLQRPTLPELVRLSADFARRTGLASDAVLDALAAVEGAGGAASMSMLGNSVFALGPRARDIEAVLAPLGDTFVVRIDPGGARLLTIQRDEGPAGPPSTGT